MLSIQRIKILIDEPNMSDKDAERVRDELRLLADIMFDQWKKEKTYEYKK
tara:strand:- start:78 stop:227 length:150 start_codon:yes stop_codon:yes gene_type:complete